MREAKAAYLRDVLQEAKGCISKAARIAGMNRGNVYRLMGATGIDTRDKRGNAAWHSLG